MACYNRILKSGNVEIYLHFADISDMQEKSLHIQFIRGCFRSGSRWYLSLG